MIAFKARAGLLGTCLTACLVPDYMYRGRACMGWPQAPSQPDQTFIRRPPQRERTTRSALPEGLSVQGRRRRRRRRRWGAKWGLDRCKINPTGMRVVDKVVSAIVFIMAIQHGLETAFDPFIHRAWYSYRTV